MLLVVYLFCLLHPLLVSGSTTEFDFSTLTLAGLKLLGDAHWNNGSLRLTKDLTVPNSGAGRALYSTPVRFRHPTSPSLASFSTFFTFSVLNLNPSSIGGGLAFLLSPGIEALGGAGGLLGLGGGRVGFIAVEFDTFMDPEFGDINDNHVGVDANSLVSLQVADLGAPAMDLKSGRLINSWIDYNGTSRTLTVSLSYSHMKPPQPQLLLPLDVGPYVDDLMFVGFSGSTQGSTEVHSIKWWSFRSSFTETTARAASSRKRGGKWGWWWAAGAVAGMVLCGGGVVWVVFWRRVMALRRRGEEGRRRRRRGGFKYGELKAATNNFEEGRIIGRGAFGRVYRGVVGGEEVAIKRCREEGGQGRRGEELMREVRIIEGLRHRNLVRLEGWCRERGEMLLVYQLMGRGSLERALFGESGRVLSWEERMKVLVGVASGLAYMHQECEKQVIHRDVKAGNILLEEGGNARLGDFGLAREVGEEEMVGGGRSGGGAAGTVGYLAPEYLLSGRASEKSDVFSYGAVVMEVVTGRRAAGGGRRNLGEWVWAEFREGRVGGVVDGRMGRRRRRRRVDKDNKERRAHADDPEAEDEDEDEAEAEEIERVVRVGLACLQGEAEARPSMRRVVQMLAGEVEVPPLLGLRPYPVRFTTAELVLSLEEEEEEEESVSDYDYNPIVIATSSSPSSSSSFSPRRLG